MNPSLLDKSLAENVKVEDATAAAVAAQAQIAALQAALASQQRQAAAQEAEKLQLQLQLLTVADAAEARAESLREAYEQAAAEAAAAREQAEQAAREAQPVQPMAQPMATEQTLVRLKLRGRFYDPNYRPRPVIIPLADGWLPEGCKLLHGVVPGHSLSTELLKLKLLMEAAPPDEKRPIRSGQPDLRRKQLKQEAGGLPISRDFMLPALAEAGELVGRRPPTEVNVIESEPGCK
eukprot:7389822-Prymnesium_polylepis.1